MKITSAARIVGLDIRGKGGRMPQPKLWILATLIGAVLTAPALGDDAAERAKRRHALQKVAHLKAGVKSVREGTSSEEARRQAIATLPTRHIAAQHRERLQSVLRNVSYFRELPVTQYEVHPEVHGYFVQHPDVAASIWRTLKLSKLELAETAPGRFELDDQKGTAGVIDVLYQDARQTVAICDGTVKSPLLPGSFRARAVLQFLQEAQLDSRQNTWVTVRLRVFVAFDSQAVEATAKLIAPLAHLIVDRNLNDVCLFVRMMNEAMIENPGWVEHIARRMKGVPPGSDREFIALAAKVYVTEKLRRGER